MIMISVAVYVVVGRVYLPVKEKNKPENRLLEVSDKKDLVVVDYSFDSNTKVRWPEDSYLMINFSKVFSEEEKSKLTFQLIPDEKFEVTYPNQYSVLIKFLKDSPKDESTYILKILFDGKQLDSIKFINSKVSTITDSGVRSE